MPTSEQLLSLQTQQTANVFNNINASLNHYADLNQQQNQFESSMMLKGAELAEQQRVNTARIAEIKSANDIRAKQFELETTLQPLKTEAAKLNLAIAQESYAQKIGHDRELAPFVIAADRSKLISEVELNKQQLINAAKQNFNEVTKSVDENVSFDIMKSGNIDYVKDWNNVKTKHFQDVVATGKYNQDAYTTDIKALKDKYKDSKPIDDYNSEFSFALGGISPSLRKEYEKKNPDFINSLNTIGTTLLTSTDSDFVRILKDYSEFIPQDKVAEITISRNQIKANEYQIKKITDGIQLEIAKTTESGKVLYPGKAQEEVRSKIDTMEAKKEELEKQTNTIITNGPSGIFGSKSLVPPEQKSLEGTSAQNNNSSIATVIQSTPAERSKKLPQYLHGLSQEDADYVNKAQIDIDNNKKGYEQDHKNALKIHDQILATSFDDKDPKKKELDDAMKAYQDSANKKLEENKKIIQNISSGVYGGTKETATAKPDTGKPLVDSSEDPTYSYFNFSSTDDFDSSTKDKFAKVYESLGVPPSKILKDGKVKDDSKLYNSEIFGVDLNWFEGQIVKNGADFTTLNNTKNKVEDNLDRIGIGNDVINYAKVKKIFETINHPIAIPISKYAMDIIHKHITEFPINTFSENELGLDGRITAFPDSGPIQDGEQHGYVVFNNSRVDTITGALVGANKGIKDSESFYKIIHTIPNDQDRIAIKKELYAGLVTAGIGSSFKN